MAGRVHVDRKGSRSDKRRPSRSVKKRPPLTKTKMESEETMTSASAKKLKERQDSEVIVDATFGYRILNFFTVFTAISACVKCKTCGGDIKFAEADIRGLGFKIVIQCDECEPQRISSCPQINKAYEINRRFIFAMRVLGQGLSAMQKFCGLMDLPKPIMQTTYDANVRNIHTAAKAVCDVSLKNAAIAEKKTTQDAGTFEDKEGITVSGDGTWKKRGFSSRFGVITLIGNLTGKVIDIIIKSSYCKACEYWEKNSNTEEYKNWIEEHSIDCAANYEGSAGKMEVDGMQEMFQRSLQLHGVKYLYYIGDGDSKTFQGILKTNPYDTPVTKKECVGHVQKRMGTRLRALVKKTKGLGGRGNLTGKLINELQLYYGLAIRRHSDSIESMKKAIWATFFHKISTDEKPQHHYCPPGEESWCSWQRACAANNLNEYRHKPALSKIVEDAIRPVYESLSEEDLLARCTGGHTQNANESLNALIWKIAPKETYSGFIIVEIAAYISTVIFNEGSMSLLTILETLNCTIGNAAYYMCQEADAQRILTGELQAQEATREARIRRRQIRLQSEEGHIAEEGQLYGAGIAD